VGRIGARVWFLIAAITALALILGCGSKGAEVSGSADDDDTDDDNVDKPEAPTLDEDRIAETTPLPYQTFWGFVTPTHRVEVLGGAEIVTTTSDPLDGQFCVEVPLIKNAVNHLEFYAIDAGGERSEPTKVDVEHNSSLEPDAQNVALVKQAYAASSSTTECPECTPDKANDDSESTWWENSVNSIFNPDALISPQWWMVDLGGEFYIKNINIKWTQEKFGTKYDIWYSLLEAPLEPHNEPGLISGQDFIYWEPVYSESHGGPENNIDGEYLLTRWVAIVLHESSYIHPISLLYKYQLLEFEVWGFEPGGNVPYDEGCP